MAKMFLKRCQNIAMDLVHEMFGVKCFSARCAFLFDCPSQPS